jgi:1-aminocyclopropane-1-carboxylate deaminase/D-cysteine desulfhydrase-like pyridoxal-dependent ACC family enzyme
MYPPEAYHKLQQHISDKILAGLKLETRLSPFNSYISPSPGRSIFLKRDDELSSGITGSKFRKYASLMHYLLEKQYDEVLLIGSAQSNNITGLAQLLNEYSLPYRLMLLESNEAILRGNLLWMHMLCDMSRVIWIKRADWPKVNILAQDLADASDKNIFVVKEGCAVPEALPGAMTLAADIIRSGSEHKTSFHHIFIDSGSGTTAIGLLLGFGIAGVKNITIHITLIAGTDEEFIAQLETLKKAYELQHQITIDISSLDLKFHIPVISPSFGSITTQVLKEALSIARTEGVLADPVYTAKQFATARYIIEKENLQDNILIIHTGGALGLSGFQEKLAKLL